MTKPTILLADNDAPVNDLLQQVLLAEGVACESVLDGAVALERVQAGGVDVLVTDLDMPRLTGLELIEAISVLPQPPRVVVVSGFIDAAVEARLAGAPVVELVLRKPFDVLEFAQSVAALARNGGEQEAAAEGAAGA